MDILEGAMLTTFTSLVVEYPCRDKSRAACLARRRWQAFRSTPAPSMPRCQTTGRCGRSAVSSVLRMRAHSVVVLEWLSILNAVPMPALLMVVLSTGAFRFSLLQQQSFWALRGPASTQAAGPPLFIGSGHIV